jgi:hypothetical protein
MTGLAAVSGAVWVAKRQDQSRRDEVRVALFDRRQKTLELFSGLSGEWWQNARLPEDRQNELRRLVSDIELLFDEPVHIEAEQLFTDTIFQNMFERHAQMFLETGQEEKWNSMLEAGEQRFKEIADRLPRLREILVSSTRVGTVFR